VVVTGAGPTAPANRREAIGVGVPVKVLGQVRMNVSGEPSRVTLT
jgi:hypothetical protein